MCNGDRRTGGRRRTRRRPPRRPRRPTPPSLVELLRQLGDLHAAGVLTDEEFAAQKSRLLA